LGVALPVLAKEIEFGNDVVIEGWVFFVPKLKDQTDFINAPTFEPNSSGKNET